MVEIVSSSAFEKEVLRFGCEFPSGCDLIHTCSAPLDLFKPLSQILQITYEGMQVVPKAIENAIQLTELNVTPFSPPFSSNSVAVSSSLAIWKFTVDFDWRSWTTISTYETQRSLTRENLQFTCSSSLETDLRNCPRQCFNCQNSKCSMFGVILTFFLLSIAQLSCNQLTTLQEQFAQLSDLVSLDVRRRNKGIGGVNSTSSQSFSSIRTHWRRCHLVFANLCILPSSMFVASTCTLSHFIKLSANGLFLVPPEIGNLSNLTKLDVRLRSKEKLTTS